MECGVGIEPTLGSSQLPVQNLYTTLTLKLARQESFHPFILPWTGALMELELQTHGLPGENRTHVAGFADLHLCHSVTSSYKWRE